MTAGNLVSPSTGSLATVVQLDPIRVVFSVSDRDVLAVQQQYEGLSPQELVKRYVPKLRLANGTESIPRPAPSLSGPCFPIPSRSFCRVSS
jgi:membrane fusion protein (multidrug efflux system)